jgi:hypothetical protein
VAIGWPWWVGWLSLTKSTTPQLKGLVDSIEQELRRGGVDRAILIIPFTVNYNGCGVGKVYVATYLNGVFTYAEIHEPREFVNPGFK